MFWGFDWAWGLPLLVLTVVAHVCAFMLLSIALVRYGPVDKDRRTPGLFIGAVALSALVAAVLHGVEAAAWACLFVGVGALSDMRDALLYSLEAITSYGHADIFLVDRWRLLGAIEAVNGLILFGLTTAFLFAAIHQVWPVRAPQR
jgi:hypothetical protein